MAGVPIAAARRLISPSPRPTRIDLFRTGTVLGGHMVDDVAARTRKFRAKIPPGLDKDPVRTLTNSSR
jgi:hypothetical protein